VSTEFSWVAAGTAAVVSIAAWVVAAADQPRKTYQVRALADRVFERLNAERRSRGAPEWERRPSLDGVASSAAERVARTGRHGLGSMDRALRNAGIRGVHRAIPILLTFRGHNDPLQAAVDLWKGYGPALEGLKDPRIDAIGLGGAVSADGTRVLVGLLVEDVEWPDYRELERETAEAVNRVRVGRGLRAMETQPELSEVARGHSLDMARRGYFSHESPEGRDLGWRLRSAGLEYHQVAENISKIRGFESPVQAAVEGWMKSRGHRDNILTPEFELSGVGVAVDEDGVVYFTQLFLR